MAFLVLDVIVLGVVSKEEEAMLHYFFSLSLVVSIVYTESLETFEGALLDRVHTGRPYIFQQNSAPSHKATITRACMHVNLHGYYSLDIWPPISVELNPKET